MIKQLQWEQLSETFASCLGVGDVAYFVRYIREGEYYAARCWGKESIGMPFTDAESAKAWCQSDYEAEVRTHLE